MANQISNSNAPYFQLAAHGRIGRFASAAIPTVLVTAALGFTYAPVAMSIGQAVYACGVFLLASVLILSVAPQTTDAMSRAFDGVWLELSARPARTIGRAGMALLYIALVATSAHGVHVRAWWLAAVSCVFAAAVGVWLPLSEPVDGATGADATDTHH